MSGAHGLGRPLVAGDIVDLPTGQLATVVFHAPDGTVLVETPWSSAQHRYDAADLTLLLAADA